MTSLSFANVTTNPSGLMGQPLDICRARRTLKLSDTPINRVRPGEKQILSVRISTLLFFGESLKRHLLVRVG